jgi:acyl-homoserine-lactone acylase
VTTAITRTLWSLLSVISVHAAFAAASPETKAPATTLYRDSYGMAHLYAAREEDAFFGLGYALAEDRLTQVLTWFVAARGELAATFGPVTPPPASDPFRDGAERQTYPLRNAIESDIDARRYRFLEVARRNLSRLPRQYQKDLRAFVRGIAAFMEDHPERRPSWAPELEPALPLALYHFQIMEEKSVCAARRAADARGATPGPRGASNAWAVDGTRTADGRVIFSSDSHGGIETYGTTFYPYRIHAGRVDVVAFDRPGTLNFVFGHSSHFAWGFSEAPRFVADCYRVRLRPGSSDTYLFDGKVVRMRSVPYAVAVKGQATVTGTFQYTMHNGVLSPVEAREGDVVYVVSYVSADRAGLSAGAGYRLATARNRVELERALAQRDLHPSNLIIGGADGTVLYIRPGRVPIRAPGLDVRGTVDGNTSATLWRGVHPYADLVKLFNPPQGYVSNSNVSPDLMYRTEVIRPTDYPAYFNVQTGEAGTRQARLRDLLEAAPRLTVDQAVRIMMDETVTAAIPWGPAISRTAMKREDLLRSAAPAFQAFLEELGRFDGSFSGDSKGALYHFELRRTLHHEHRSEMDALQAAVESGTLRADQEALLITAAEQAWRSITERFGTVELTWGDVHRAGRGNVDLPVGGGVVLLGVERGGTPWDQTSLGKRYLGIDMPARSAATPRALRYDYDPRTHLERMISGQRIPFLVHFGKDGVESFAQSLWGVSDDAASPHYSDQAQLASENRLRRISLTTGELASERARSTTLTPR